MVTIKNFGMPSCCGECNLTTCKGKDEPWNYCCAITLKDINLDDTERPSDCPLVEIGKVGKWIRKPIRNDKGGCIGAEMICSYCNKDNRYDEYMDYCPNCGAKMGDDEDG
jgi:hypothetical protein